MHNTQCKLEHPVGGADEGKPDLKSEETGCRVREDGVVRKRMGFPCTSNSSIWDVWRVLRIYWVAGRGNHGRPAARCRDLSEAARKRGLTIRHIIETQLHADFVSGQCELARHTGAQIYLSSFAGATLPYVDVDHGYKLRVGKLGIQVLATPGHTPESICLLVTDEERGTTP